MDTVVIVAGVKEEVLLMDADYIGVDEGCSFCVQSGIKPVLGIGDFDSTSEVFDFKTIKYDSEKDETDLELALQYAVNRYKHIYVCNCIGGRSDHFLYNLKLLIQYPQIVLCSPSERIYIVNKGKHIIHNTHRYFSFFAIENSIVSLDGFKYSLHNCLLTPKDFKTISNEIVRKSGIIEVTDGCLLCIQSEIKEV